MSRTPGPAEGNGVPHLTRCEQEILALLIHPKHFTVGEISRYLDISTRTVEKHIERLYVKFGVQKRKELRSFSNEINTEA